MTILEQLPARVDALALQVSQLRDEMHAEFSAVRGEIEAGDEETRRVLRGAADEIMGQARSLYENALSRIALMEEGRLDRPKRE